MANYKVPLRQTHLDFHTSPDIENIGGNFSKENFQAALKEGNLDSITVFAKCHHSMCYYPTKVGIMHPHLDFDLTGAMVDAAHEIGVRAPIYITAGWSHKDAQEHPERHRHLIVRVWGWSGYFVELDKEYQDQIIKRVELSGL